MNHRHHAHMCFLSFWCFKNLCFLVLFPQLSLPNRKDWLCAKWSQWRAEWCQKPLEPKRRHRLQAKPGEWRMARALTQRNAVSQHFFSCLCCPQLRDVEIHPSSIEFHLGRGNDALLGAGANGKVGSPLVCECLRLRASCWCWWWFLLLFLLL